MRGIGRALGAAGLAALAFGPSTALAQEPAADAAFDLHFQLTAVTQAHPSFDAPYSGRNSLSPDAEHETTVTSTLFLGARLWRGAELYVNPELSGGSGLSRTLGVAGFPNGEAFRVGDPQPRVYLARAYLRQTLAVGAETEAVEEDANQLGGRRPLRRWTITAGRFGIGDFLDANAYSHDPRTQFMNWAVWTGGAWDYAADTRGYTWGFVIGYEEPDWAARFAGAAEPRVANGNEFDHDALHAYELAAELDRSYSLSGKRGTARLIVFYNRSRMGSYREALEEAEADGAPPDVTATRRAGRSKWGFVANLEQPVAGDLGLFLRASWNDGANEAWAYAEIERSLTAGGIWNGPLSARPDDAAGIAFVVNGLSGDHRDYLAAGGYGFMIGDGRLDYGLEKIAEIFYRALLVAHAALTLDYQFVENPAYNRDRGPAHVFGARVHVEF